MNQNLRELDIRRCLTVRHRNVCISWALYLERLFQWILQRRRHDFKKSKIWIWWLMFCVKILALYFVSVDLSINLGIQIQWWHMFESVVSLWQWDDEWLWTERAVRSMQWPLVRFPVAPLVGNTLWQLPLFCHQQPGAKATGSRVWVFPTTTWSCCRCCWLRAEPLQQPPLGRCCRVGHRCTPRS